MAKRSQRKKRTSGKAPATRDQAGKTPPAKPALIPWEKILPRALLIIAVGLWIYWPVLHGDWLWDDDYLISENPLIHDSGGLWNIWFNPSTLIDYFPLTVSVEWLEWQIWPNDTFVYHLTSVLCHLVSALLVWLLFTKLGLRLAWLAGLLFAIYPVQVESVAWIAELKNTLAMPPFLLAMCAWIDYDRRRKLEDYFLAMSLFLTAMLCKTSMVMFPVVILLYAWWKRGKITWSDLKISAPFFAISLAVGLALISFLRHGIGEQFIPLGGFFSHMACAGLSISFYFSKCVLPVELLPIYPQWKIDPPSLVQFAPWLVLGGVICWLWTRREPWTRHVLFGLGFFLLNLFPFVGLHTISFMRFTWVMDHFLYLPLLGWLGLAVAALERVHDRLSAARRPYLIGIVAIVMILLTCESHRYAKIFVNSEALWTYAIHHSPDAWPAHNNLGNALLEAGRQSEAKVQYLEALRLNPDYPEAHTNLGNILFYEGRKSEAIKHYEEALRLNPDYAIAQDNLSKVLNSPQPAPAKN